MNQVKLSKFFLAPLALIFLISSAAYSQQTPATDIWNQLLKNHVNVNGGVSYEGFENDLVSLTGFIDSYKSLSPATLDDASKTAYYINLYNATMIFNILKYTKEKKIKVGSDEFLNLKINDIKVEGGNIWNGKYKVNLAGIDVNLDNIEHGLIRGKADGDLGKLKVKVLDPRIHAAVNCAALSCPRVRELAYTAENLESLLQENMIAYLSSNKQFSKKDKDTMSANSIVFWYYADFDDHGQDVLKLKGAGDYLVSFIKDTPDLSWKKTHLKENFNARNRLSLKLSSAFDFNYDWKINDIKNYSNQ